MNDFGKKITGFDALHKLYDLANGSIDIELSKRGLTKQQVSGLYMAIIEKELKLLEIVKQAIYVKNFDDERCECEICGFPLKFLDETRYEIFKSEFEEQTKWRTK